MTNCNFFSRRNKVIRFLEKNEENAVFLVRDPVDLYYLTGFLVSRGTLFLSKNTQIFFVDNRYLAACKKEDRMQIKEFSEENLTCSIQKEKVSTLFFDKSKTSYLSYEKLQNLGVSLVPADAEIEKVRAVKDQQEISFLQEAQLLLEKGFHAATSSLKEGISEKEVAWIFERYVREKGGESLSFDPIVAFGENSAYPHHHSGDTRLKKGDIVLLDMGVTCNHYRSDRSRTFLFGKENEANQKFKKMYDAVYGCQKHVIKCAKIGMEGKQLEEIARNYLEKINYEKYFNHSLGHGIGLDIHELPKISKISEDKILENMIFTIEPGVYIEGFGGVRIEDSVVMTKNGACMLSEYLP